MWWDVKCEKEAVKATERGSEEDTLVISILTDLQVCSVMSKLPLNIQIGKALIIFPLTFVLKLKYLALYKKKKKNH